MADCKPDVEVDFEDNGAITFRIDTGDCKDSAGDIDFEGEVENAKGEKKTIRKNETWTRTTDKSTTKVEYDFHLYADEKLNRVTIVSASCKCYS